MMQSNQITSNVGSENDDDQFKPVFKYYKSRKPPPDLGQLLDPSNQPLFEKHFRTVPPYDAENSSSLSKRYKELGLTDPEQWKIYRLENVNGAGDGITLVTDPFTAQGQMDWSVKCLRDYARSPPNKTNLDAFHHESQGTDPFYWWHAARSDEDAHINKLRWATLGYHHDWDTKVYSTHQVSCFPQDLAELSHFLLANIPTFASQVKSYTAEAAIVNFYPIDATLGGHTDHSEPNLHAPLVSISFGQSAIFLIGGPTKHIKPVALLINSGDVVIMSENARQSFHGVPRIVECAHQMVCDTDKNEEPDKEFCRRYLNTHRINMNIRQVF